MKAMIFAAGLGSRLKPWTDHHPKALALVNGKSLLQRNIQYLQQHGIGEVVVNVHHFADQIVDAIEANKGWGSVVHVSDERDAVLETGGGLLKAAPFFKGKSSGGSSPKPEPFVVMNADILTNLDLGKLIQAHRDAEENSKQSLAQQNATSTAAQNFALQNKPLATLAVMQRPSSRCFWVNPGGRLVGWERQPKGDDPGQRRPADLVIQGLQAKAFSGIHIIDPQLFSLIRFEGKFSMIDVYLDLCTQHWIQTFDHSGDLLLDVGKPESLEQAAHLFGG